MFFNKSIIYKLALPVPVIILLCLAVAWFVIPKVVGDNAIKTATQSALQTANQFKIIRGYYTKNVIAKAKADGNLKPSIDHAGKPGTIPLPATLIHDLSKLLSKEQTTMALYSAFPFPNRKNRKLDDFKKSAWEFLSKNPDEVFKRREVHGGKTVMRVAIADKMSAEGCVNCHNAHPQTPKNDWKLDDVRGVLEIDADITAPLAAAMDLKNSILIGIFIAGLAIFAIVIAGARAISRPIKQITGIMGKVADGDLTNDVPYLDRMDEVGHMAKALSVFKENILHGKELEDEQAEQEKLRKSEQEDQLALDQTSASERQMVNTSFGKAMAAISDKDLSYRITDAFPSDYQSMKDDFNTAIEQLSSTIQQIGDELSQINSGSKEINAAADNLARRTERQASTVQEIASSVDETSSAMRTSTERANEVSGLVVATKNNAEESGEVVKDAVAAMLKIENSAKEIANIIGVIDEISFQTNLLALNAGVEAARAGDAGRGFAVVATEVRELAQRSADAAKEIKTLITTSGTDVKAGAALVNQTGEALARIVSEVKNVSEHVTAMTEAAREQAAGLQEINDAVNAIDSGTQQNAAVAEQSSAASQTLASRVANIDGMLNAFNTNSSLTKPTLVQDVGEKQKEAS
ncbi:MAG: methyl-accepting chemotaxis protein [Rhizobiaceae bacterium]